MNGRTKASLKSLLLKAMQLKATADKAQRDYREAHDKLMLKMQEHGVTKFPVELDAGEVVTGTLVESSTLSVDMAALEEAVSREVFDRVTKRSVDMTAFRNAVAEGAISLDIAEEIVVETPRQPYLRISEK
jgi:hypothetical protein